MVPLLWRSTRGHKKTVIGAAPPSRTTAASYLLSSSRRLFISIVSYSLEVYLHETFQMCEITAISLETKKNLKKRQQNTNQFPKGMQKE